MTVRERDQVFISYSHGDKPWLEHLQMHLKPYVRNTTISVWDDSQLRVGANWREEIQTALQSAKVAVLLVSPAFLASDFIAEQELPRLLEAARKKGLTIFWIPVSHSSFEETEIANYQAAHDPSHPLNSLSDADQAKALVNICKKIKQLAPTHDTTSSRHHPSATSLAPSNFPKAPVVPRSGSKRTRTRTAPDTLQVELLAELPLSSSDWQSVKHIVFSPDGENIISASSSRTIWRWLLPDLELLDCVRCGKHRDDAMDCAFSDDTQTLATASDCARNVGKDKAARLWRVADGKCLCTLKHEASVLRVAISPDGSVMATGTGLPDGQIRLWSMPDGSLIHTVQASQAEVSHLSFSPDGSLLASGSDRVRIWRVLDGKLLKTLRTGQFRLGSETYSAAFSPDTATLAVGCQEPNLPVELFNVQDGKSVCSFNEQQMVLTLAFSPDGRILAVGTYDGTISLRRVSDGKQLCAVTHDDAEFIYAIAFSPDGSMFATGGTCEFGTGDDVRIWEII